MKTFWTARATMNASQRESYALNGFVVIPAAISQDLVADLNRILTARLAAGHGVPGALRKIRLSALQPPVPALDGSYGMMGPGRPYDGPASFANDRPIELNPPPKWDEIGEPGSSSTSAFRALIDAEQMKPVLEELLCDPVYGHVLPGTPPEHRAAWRL